MGRRKGGGREEMKRERRGEKGERGATREKGGKGGEECSPPPFWWALRWRGTCGVIFTLNHHAHSNGSPMSAAAVLGDSRQAHGLRGPSHMRRRW